MLLGAERLRNYEAGSPWQSEVGIKSNCCYEVIPKGSLNHQLKEGDPDDANIVIGPK